MQPGNGCLCWADLPWLQTQPASSVGLIYHCLHKTCQEMPSPWCVICPLPNSESCCSQWKHSFPAMPCLVPSVDMLSITADALGWLPVIPAYHDQPTLPLPHKGVSRAKQTLPHLLTITSCRPWCGSAKSFLHPFGESGTPSSVYRCGITNWMELSNTHASPPSKTILSLLTISTFDWRSWAKQ